MRARRRWALLSAPLLVLAWLGALVLPAQAAPTGSMSVALTAVAPQVATPTTDVVLTLTVRNTGATPLTDVRATAALGSRRFAERGEVGAWTTSTQPVGAVVAQAASAAPGPIVAPGASAPVTVTVPRTAWHLGRPFAVVPVELAVTAGGAATTRTRTVVPWVAATPQYLPLRMAWAVPLTAPADPRLFTAPGPPALAAWQDAVGPTSVVRRRLAAAGTTPVTWFVDPTLVTAQRYVARTPATTPDAPAATVATAATLTRELVTALQEVPATQNVWSLPPGDPDTAVLAGRTLATSLTDRLYPAGPSALDTALGAPAPRTTAWPADGVWSPAREQAWARATGGYPTTTALVSTASLAASKGYSPGAVNRSSGGTGLLAYDEELSDIAGGTASGAGALDRAGVVQRFLAESMVLLGEREGTARSVVVTIPRSAPVDDATLRDLWGAVAKAPWLRPTTLPALAAQLPTAPVVATRTPPVQLEPASPLTATALGEVSGSADRVSALAGILPTAQGPVAQRWADVSAQALSARWRTNASGAASLRTVVDRAVRTTSDAVQVSPANVNFLTDAGAIAITVTNDLPYPVTGVRLHLTPGNGKLRVDRQPAPITIKARSRTSVRVDVTALGSGEVPVLARLSTPSGTGLGTPRTVTMNVRPPAEWVLYAVGGLVALVLVGGLARTLTRRQTRAERDELLDPDAAPPRESDDAPTDASAPWSASPDRRSTPESTP